MYSIHDGICHSDCAVYADIMIRVTVHIAD